MKSYHLSGLGINETPLRNFCRELSGFSVAIWYNMAPLKVYVASITANPEIRKRVQRTLMLLDGLGIPFDSIDIAKPGNAEHRVFMRENAEMREGDRGAPMPPQFFYNDEYLGNYTDFEEAVENERYTEFLRLVPNSKPPPVEEKKEDEEEKSKAKDSKTNHDEKKTYPEEVDADEGEEEDEEEGEGEDEEEDEGEGEDEEWEDEEEGEDEEEPKTALKIPPPKASTEKVEKAEEVKKAVEEPKKAVEEPKKAAEEEEDEEVDEEEYDEDEEEAEAEGEDEEWEEEDEEEAEE